MSNNTAGEPDWLVELLDNYKGMSLAPMLRETLRVAIYSRIEREKLEAKIEELELHKDERCVCAESGIQACDALWHHSNNIDDRISELRLKLLGDK